jgi:hypothetical protein
MAKSEEGRWQLELGAYEVGWAGSSRVRAFHKAELVLALPYSVFMQRIHRNRVLLREFAHLHEKLRHQ